jgi:hypothetical protein
MTFQTRICTLLIAVCLVLASVVADEKPIRLRRQIVALGDGDVAKQPRGEFLENLWSGDAFLPERHLGAGRPDSYEMSMSMSMSFELYF